MRSVRSLAGVCSVRRSVPPASRAPVTASSVRALSVIAPRAAAIGRDPARQLIDLLRTSDHTAADRVWALYVEAVQDKPQELDDGSVRVPRTLRAAEHREVLHALVPYSEPYAAYISERARLRELRAQAQHTPLDAAVPVDLSTPQELAPRAPPVPQRASDARVYLSRVQALLGNMRAEPGGVAAADYNHALEVLAHGGHYAEMKVLFDEMTAMRASIPALAPSRPTYDVMLRGLFEHARHETDRLRAAYGHALNPTAHTRRIAQATAAEGQAAKAVQGAAKHAAREATTLIQDMQQHAVRPSTLTLDLAARVLRVTGQLPALLALLRTGFGVDVANPDADRGETTLECVPTTHTLNTVLMALGEHATVANMMTAYETMTQPLPGAGAAGAAGAREVAELGAASRSVQPNTKTFSVLLKHACSASDTLFLSAALVPARRSLLSRLASTGESIGFATQRDLRDEIRRRERGHYLSVARYLLDECVDRYAAQVATLCTQLRVDAPGLALAEPAAQRAIGAAHRAWRARGEPPGALAIAEAHVAPRDGVPALVPPGVGVSLDMVYPLVSLASRRRSTTQLRWVRARMSRVLLLKTIEANAAQLVASRVADRPEFAASLEAHRARTQREIDALHWLLFERLPARQAALAALRRERRERRAAGAASRDRAKRRTRRRREAEAPFVLSSSPAVA
ncbi:hypothetical protein MOBT1_001323 [Malassezia obtusa]|uniref:Uncharacterized protein n=1 Tax=Malassezia obtusa TaxID=76774 RepID=A0AAF0IRP4_9BASI|nr:hypothetical protein MOBT1_001323 [Malassezia obtusa]